MKRLLLAALLTLFAVAPLTSASWPLERINKSVGKVTGDKAGTCSASSINERKGFWLMALHCNTLEGLKINDVPTKLVAEYPDYDLAVYNSVTAPALSLGPRPKLGDEILSIGYAYGAPFPTAIPAIVLNHNTIAPEEQFFYQWQYPNHIRGMSGGPVVNRSGQIVGVIDCAYEEVGCTIMYEAVAVVVKKYR